MTQETLRWVDNSAEQFAVWPDDLHLLVPKWIEVVDDSTRADQAFRMASEGCGMVYKGDFQNARQLLQAMARRVDKKPFQSGGSLLDTFHLYRARQIHRSNILSKLLIHLKEGQCLLKRAPETHSVIEQALQHPVPASLLLPLHHLQGMIGAYQWRKQGVYIAALDQRIYPHYGVFSPIRGEYLDLIAQAPLQAKTAWDIGTGTGVVAGLLAKRGVSRIIATDNQPRALACARENMKSLGWLEQVQVISADLFPEEGKADLIVCNPPWLPAKAHNPIEHALYDPESRMLKAFLSGVGEYLLPHGEAWLIMSDLAERIGLRKEGELITLIQSAGLEVIEQRTTRPVHKKSRDATDPLFEARQKEVTSLYRMRVA